MGGRRRLVGVFLAWRADGGGAGVSGVVRGHVGALRVSGVWAGEGAGECLRWLLRPGVRPRVNGGCGRLIPAWGHMWARGGCDAWKKVHRSRACEAGNVPLSYELL